MHKIDAFEAGVVTTPGDQRVHAVRVTLRGRQALCGAGPISEGVVGRFTDVTARGHVCLSCFAIAVPLPHLAS
ncbi:MAG TPA: hypothetical protein VFJ98_08815 [Mycobacteriales bacterium]|nr:hypothetical protein [Mycobacteriales bacterium]